MFIGCGTFRHTANVVMRRESEKAAYSDFHLLVAVGFGFAHMSQMKQMTSLITKDSS